VAGVRGLWSACGEMGGRPFTRGEGVVLVAGSRIEVRASDVVTEARTVQAAGTGTAAGKDGPPHRIPSGRVRPGAGGAVCLTGYWWTWAGMGRPRFCHGQMGVCRRRGRGRRSRAAG
jgi:hypothetical protein